MFKLKLSLLLLLPFNAFAAAGEVCLIEKPAAGKSPGHLEITNEAKFKCPTAGLVTIPDLYNKGWKVVTMIPQTEGDPRTGMISGRWTLIIEKI